ncbi:MAG: helix-turn-helix transcriptional regulator [Lachnospiraceae bacterium]|nr:helix-turn-helix transcriptional regulator [Lachnospiraceae bacterium]
MDIGKQLKDARISAGLTQENVAEKINVSRQTISNWENEKTYPDLISIIKLSDLYGISLDALLKGDEKMIEHLKESTNVVKSNQKLITAIIINILVVIVFVLVGMFQTENYAFLVVAFSVAVISSSFLLFQMIKKF